MRPADADASGEAESSPENEQPPGNTYSLRPRAAAKHNAAPAVTAAAAAKSPTINGKGGELSAPSQTTEPAETVETSGLMDGPIKKRFKVGWGCCCVGLAGLARAAMHAGNGSGWHGGSPWCEGSVHLCMCLATSSSCTSTCSLTDVMCWALLMMYRSVYCRQRPRQRQRSRRAPPRHPQPAARVRSHLLVLLLLTRRTRPQQAGSLSRALARQPLAASRLSLHPSLCGASGPGQQTTSALLRLRPATAPLPTPPQPGQQAQPPQAPAVAHLPLAAAQAC
jgi:hypothetical protein